RDFHVTGVQTCALPILGTLNERTVASMMQAGLSANKHQTPVVLDPVGVGATKFRAETAQQLLDLLKIDVIRCNIGELAALAGARSEERRVGKECRMGGR